MSLGHYVSMLGDRRRIEGFQQGLASAVHPGDNVLDVGTGLGTYAFFAAQAGAGHVWAVDRDPVIHAAAMVCKANGFDDRITFLRGEISEVELPEPADLVVFEDFPIRLFDDRTWCLVRDVLGKHLRPGGRVFPTRMRLNLGLAAGPEPEALVALGEEDAVWGQTLLPVSPPLKVPARGQVRASVRPEPLPDGAPGWLSWAVEYGVEARNGHEFAAEPSSLEDLYGDILGMKAAETLPSREIVP